MNVEDCTFRLFCWRIYIRYIESLLYSNPRVTGMFVKLLFHIIIYIKSLFLSACQKCTQTKATVKLK